MKTTGDKIRTADRTIGQFMETLGSKSPVPGGGGAAALAGALGASLSAMVCGLTVGKKKYEAHEAELKDLLNLCTRAAERFISLSDADEAAFLPLSAVYGMPRETEEELKKRGEAMEKALKNAAEIPMEVLELCAETIAEMHCLTEIGSRLAVSDVGAAASMLSAGLDSAYLNVMINVGMMQERAEAERLGRRASSLRDKGRQEAAEIFEDVRKQLEIRR